MGAQRLDLALEVVGRGERPIHRREPQICDFVEIAQRPEDGQTDLVTGHLRRPAGTHRILDLLRQEVQRVVVDLAALARAAHAPDHLLAAERLGDAAALHDGQHGGLHGGEPAATLRA